MATFFSVLAELISSIGMLGIGLGVLLFGEAMCQCVDELEKEIQGLIVPSGDENTEE